MAFACAQCGPSKPSSQCRHEQTFLQEAGCIAHFACQIMFRAAKAPYVKCPNNSGPYRPMSKGTGSTALHFIYWIECYAVYVLIVFVPVSVSVVHAALRHGLCTVSKIQSTMYEHQHLLPFCSRNTPVHIILSGLVQNILNDDIA